MPRASRAQTPADAIALLAAPIDESLTLSAWLARSPNDSVSRRRPTGAIDDYFCRSASATIAIGGVAFTRHAVFFLPRPPAGETLPQQATPEQNCRLGAIWLEATATESSADRTADMLQARLATVLGVGESGVAMHGSGTGLWRHAWSWKRPDGGAVVLGVQPATAAGDDGEGTPARPPIVVAAAYVANTGMSYDFDRVLERDDVTEVDPETLVALARADSALVRSGLTALAGDLSVVEALVRDTVRPIPRRPASDSAIVHIVEGVRTAAPRLPPAQRSAALFVADAVVRAAAATFNATSDSASIPALERRLAALGVPYVDDHFGGVHAYDNTWLRDAYALDSLGATGRSAAAERLRFGWASGPMCGGSDTGEDFRAVIEHGEWELRRGNNDPMIHYFVGLAYADIVALAAGAGQEYADASRYVAEAATARERAVERFRSALVSLRDPHLRRAAWDRAMRMMLRMSHQTRYFCVYD